MHGILRKEVPILWLNSFFWNCTHRPSIHKIEKQKKTMSSPSTRVLVFGHGQHGLGRPEGTVYKPSNLSPPPVNDGDTPSQWTQIACGMYHTAGLSSKGEVFTWGDDGEVFHESGWLGHGDDEDEYDKAAAVISFGGKMCNVYERDRYVPTKVRRLSGETIVKVICRSNYTMALAESGKLFEW